MTNPRAKLLVTGGAVFIGSHTAMVMLEAGHELLVFDDFGNSNPIALERVRELAGPAADPRLRHMQGEIRNPRDLEQALTKAPQGLMRWSIFAGLKGVGQSVEKPRHYWDVNGSRCLLEAMQTHGCHSIIFSSSGTHYGYPEALPIQETAPIAPIVPYGHTKAAVEQMLNDLHASAEDSQRIVCLRCFNPVGAHPSGRTGENPLGMPNNLFPFVSQVEVGCRAQLEVFCGDWTPPDATGGRDTMHVMELAEGNRAALDCLKAKETQVIRSTLAAARVKSVLEVATAMEAASGRSIPYAISERRRSQQSS